jgi:hypothetical protein
VKHVLGIGLGLQGGLLLNFEIGAVFAIASGGFDHSASNSGVTLLTVLWALFLMAVCSFVLLVRSDRVSSVFMRGCAMGLVLWTAMVPLASYLGRVLAGPEVKGSGIDALIERMATEPDRDAAHGFASLLTNVAATMIVLTAAALVATYLATRRSTPRTAMRTS